MGKAKSKIMTIFIVITVIFSFQVVAFAATTWSDKGTIALNRDTDWKRNTTTGVYIVNTKTTSSTSVTVYTLSKTMTSNPQFRIVNSNNEARCAAFSMPSAGKEKTNTSNTGDPGYNYYASVKPAWNQVANDQSVRLQFKSH